MHSVENWRVDRGFLTLGRSLAVSAKRFPEKIAVHDPDGKISYLELNQNANQLAYGLRDLGVAKGHHVAILFGNSIAHLTTIYAVAKLGAVSVVLDIKWKAREVLQALQSFDCDLLLYDSAYTSAVTPETLRALRFGGFCLSDKSSNLIEGQPVTEFASDVKDDDLFMIMLTAGTTGIPKGCMVNHRTYAVQCMNSAIGRAATSIAKSFPWCRFITTPAGAQYWPISFLAARFICAANSMRGTLWNSCRGKKSAL